MLGMLAKLVLGRRDMLGSMKGKHGGVYVKGELQHENKLISYERAFKMLENDMYITVIGQTVLELSSFNVGSGNLLT